MAATFPGWESASSDHTHPEYTRAGQLERVSPTRVPQQEAAGVIPKVAPRPVGLNLLRGPNHIDDSI